MLGRPMPAEARSRLPATAPARCPEWPERECRLRAGPRRRLDAAVRTPMPCLMAFSTRLEQEARHQGRDTSGSIDGDLEPISEAHARSRRSGRGGSSPFEERGAWLRFSARAGQVAQPHDHLARSGSAPIKGRMLFSVLKRVGPDLETKARRASMTSVRGALPALSRATSGDGDHRHPGRRRRRRLCGRCACPRHAAEDDMRCSASLVPDAVSLAATT